MKRGAKRLPAAGGVRGRSANGAAATQAASVLRACWPGGARAASQRDRGRRLPLACKGQRHGATAFRLQDHRPRPALRHSRLQPVLLLCAVALAGWLAVAPAHAQRPFSSSDAADIVALTVCVIDADIRHAAVEQLRRGAPQVEVLRAVEVTLTDPAYRRQAERIVNEVWRAQPAAPRPYVADRLQRCVAGAAQQARVAAADGCYQLTRYARDFFAARDGGVSLGDTRASIQLMATEQGMSDAGAARLGEIARRVYETRDPPAQYRAGLFYYCVTPGRGGK